MKVKLTRNQINLLERGTVFVGPNGQKWYYLPFWYKHEGGNDFEQFSFDHLPEDFVEAIHEHREGLGYVVVKPKDK